MDSTFSLLRLQVDLPTPREYFVRVAPLIRAPTPLVYSGDDFTHALHKALGAAGHGEPSKLFIGCFCHSMCDPFAVCDADEFIACFNEKHGTNLELGCDDDKDVAKNTVDVVIQSL